MNKVIVLIMYFLCGFAQVAFAQPAIVIKKTQDLLQVGDKIMVLADSSAKLTIQDILTSPIQQRFKPNHKLVFNRKPSHTAYWVRFEVKNETNRKLWLNLGDSRSWNIDFFSPNKSGKYTDSLALGAMRPQLPPYLFGKYYCVPLAHLQPNQTQVYYARLTGDFVIAYSFQIGTTIAITRKLEIYNYTLALFIGLVMAMGVYNLFLFFSTKDKIYLVYVGYLTMVFFSTPFNIGQSLFWGKWLWQYFIVWQAALFWFMTLFVDLYLSLATNAPKMRRWLWLLTWVAGGVFPLSNLLGISLIYLITPLQLLTLVYTFSLLTCGVYLVFKNVKEAFFYTFGWSSVVVGSFVYLMTRNGVLPLNMFTSQVLYLGFGIETLLFSLALGDRLNRLKKEKEKAQAENLLLMTRQKQGLEAKVTQRTNDIATMNQKLALATKSAGIGIWEYNHATNRIIWDEQTYRLYDDTKQSFDGSLKQWLSYVHANDLELVKKTFKDLKKAQKVSNVDLRIVTPQKEVRWLCFSAILLQNKEGGWSNIVGTIHDITALKTFNEQLKESNLLLDSVNYVQREFIVSENIDAVFEFLLLKLINLTNSAQGTVGEAYQLENQPLHFSAFATTDIHLLSQHTLLEQVMAQKQPVIINDVSLPEANPPSIYHFLGIPLFMRDQVIGVALMASDQQPYRQNVIDKLDPLLATAARLISAYKKEQERLVLIEKLKQTTLDAKQASIAKSEFLANMSHEIRTPLNGVIGFVDLLLQTELSNTQKQYLSIVSQSGNTLLSIINDILDFSKIEAGKMELLPTKTNLVAMCNGLKALMSYQTKQKGLSMNLLLADDLPRYAWCDEMRLKQVLTNLLSNAVKFTHEGAITLQVEMLEKNEHNKALFRFLVQDTGIGIMPENQQKIFEAFSQEDSSTTKRFGGTGLGLSISNRLLNLMQSHLQLESTYHKGSAFYFDIWLDSWSEEPSYEGNDLPCITQVLLIHNSQTQGEKVEQMLEPKGVTFTIANNGIEGIGKLQANPDYDVVLVAQDMPFMNGIQTIIEIRHTLGLKAVPIVLMHDNVGKNLSKECDDLGVYAQLPDLGLQASELYKVLSKLSKEKSRLSVGQEKADVDNALQKILIVEDNPINLLLITEIISGVLPEVKILTALNGEEAVSEYKAQLPEIILMDVQMPVMNGYEATKKIRQIEFEMSKQPSKIVAVTAGVLNEEKAKCIEAGMNEFVSKPITKNDIQRIVASK